jgi:2-iminobutanoate/2-iminopropanoate deaminase
MQDRRVVPSDRPADVFSGAVTAGGFVFVSSLSAREPRALGAQEPEPDIRAETALVLDRLRQTLERAGSSLAQVVSVNVYLKRAADFDAMNGVYRERIVVDPPVRATVVTDLANGALVEMSAIAVPLGARREVLHPSGWMKSPRPYSFAVRANGLVFLAGLVSRRPSDDQVVPGSTQVQTRTILDNAGTLLRTAGLEFSDVLAARVYLTDDTYFEEMNTEYRKTFASDPPARATSITGLMGTEAQVEISLVAATEGMEPFGPSVWPTLPISTATRAGNLSFLSGVMGNTESNRGDAAAQARQAFARLARTLESAGLSFADVVDCTIYLPDLWQSAKVDAVFKEMFPKDPPARTMVGAKLATRDAAVEILLTAVK